MEAIVKVLFGPSWKSSLIGLAAGLITAAVTYAQAKPEPGWYVVAFALAALGRVVKDADKSNAPQPTPTSLKVG
jgi:hypothetical protein